MRRYSSSCIITSVLPCNQIFYKCGLSLPLIFHQCDIAGWDVIKERQRDLVLWHTISSSDEESSLTQNILAGKCSA